MNPAAMIQQAQADGVNLALMPDGNLRISGNKATVRQWLETLRTQKEAIVNTLAADSIRAWLAHIGETDPAMVNEVMERCRTDTDACAYFLKRAREPR